jgi:Fic family protein
MEESEIQPEKRNDWHEISNYTRAMNYAVERLKTFPLSVRLLKETHAIMLSNVRGEKKLPGEIRRSQNWIGGSSLKDAYFIPPHYEEINDLLTDLEKFLHNEELNIQELIKAALAHYQFETIHPVLDGNGRLGRLLITLFFVDKKILLKPTLYLSDFFERNKGSYYDALTLVRSSNNIDHWLKFFLSGVIETADSSIQTFEKIIELQKNCEKKILKLGRRVKVAHILLQFLYSRPIVDTNLVCQKLKLTHPSASTLLKEFVNLNILKETTGFERNRLYSFHEYISAFKN